MKTAAIIQARIGSHRLWGKVLRALPTGRLVLEEVLYRASQVKGVDVVVCAIPDTLENEILAHVVGKECRAGRPVWVTQGPEHDVLKRYAKAADEVGAEIVLRITSDCPLLNPTQCELVLNKVLSGEHDFAANSGPGSFSLGWSCEAFTADLLRQADDTSTDPIAREHVGPGPRALAKSPAYITIPEVGSDLRPSLDTKDDYLAVLWAFQHEMRAAA